MYKILFWAVLFFIPVSATAQDWRLSGGYNIQNNGITYVPNKNYPNSLNSIVKSTIEMELERYLFYRFYIAGKADYLLQNQEEALIGGPINFKQANIGGYIGMQWPKFGFYAGVEAGRIWDLTVKSTNRDGEQFWVKPTEPVNSYTTAFSGGIKYYLLNFVRIQAEVTQSHQPPTDIKPRQEFSQPAAVRSFDFKSLAFTLGISISIPWNSKKRIKQINKEEKLPPLMSVRSLDFSSPLKTQTVVTSLYGPRWRGTHQGVDLSAGLNDDILAAESGIVRKAGEGSGYGKLIRIQHSNGFETVYAHLMKIKVKEGDRVKKGQVIGKAGNTGTSTGVHLHFEIIKDGKHVNPLSYLRF